MTGSLTYLLSSPICTLYSVLRKEIFRVLLYYLVRTSAGLDYSVVSQLDPKEPHDYLDSTAYLSQPSSRLYEVALVGLRSLRSILPSGLLGPVGKLPTQARH